MIKESSKKISELEITNYMDLFVGQKSSFGQHVYGEFTKDLKEEAMKKMHLTAYEAAKYARLSESKKLVITHFSSRYTEKSLSFLLKEAKSSFKEVFLAKKGDVYPILLED